MCRDWMGVHRMTKFQGIHCVVNNYLSVLFSQILCYCLHVSLFSALRVICSILILEKWENSMTYIL